MDSITRKYITIEKYYYQSKINNVSMQQFCHYLQL
jgi:hypothetical protein